MAAAHQAASSLPGADSSAPEVKSAWRKTAWVAALFCLLVAGFLGFRYAQAKRSDPLDSPKAIALMAKIQAAPNSDSLKQQFRELDLQLRRRYFNFLTFTATGAWLALLGGIAFVWTAKRAAAPRAPNLLPKSDPVTSVTREAHRARLLVGVVAALFLTGFLGLALTTRSPLPAHRADLSKLLAKLSGHGPAPVVDLPSAAEWQANWPRFLGPNGNNFAPNFHVPAKLAVAWKVKVPVVGFNSPIIWGNRVYLSGGNATNREVLAFDLPTGAVAWRRVVKVPGPPVNVDVPDMTGYAASSMATDGRRVYVIFANGDLAAFTLAGQPVWAKNLGAPKNEYGHASSLAIWQGKLIIQLDQGQPRQGLSRLDELDGVTGRVLWQERRPVGESWATPTVYTVGGQTQIATLGGQWVIGYRAQDGTELWRVQGLTGEITPSPIFANGLVFAVSPSDRMFAIRPNGQGNVTKTNVAWTTEENVADISSPCSNGQLVLMATSIGMLTCFDAQNGKKLWEQDLSTDINASPAIAGNQVVVLGKEGSVIVAEAARKFKQLAKLGLGEDIYASPAFKGSWMIVRTDQSLVAFHGQPAGSSPVLEAKRP